MYLDELLDLTMDWNCIATAKEFALENSLRYINVKMMIEFFDMNIIDIYRM